MQKPFLRDNKDKLPPQREKLLNIPPVVLVFFAVCCLAYLIPAYGFSANMQESFYAFFGFVPILFLHNHDVITQISAVSYSFLHGSLTHLGLNMLWLIIFGTPLANRLGSAFFVIFWLVTSFVAAFAYCLLNPAGAAMMIGASGAISGMMGAAARYNFQAIGGCYAPGAILSVRQALTSRAVVVALGSFIVLNVLTAFDEGQIGFTEDTMDIAWQAHLGGLLAGFFSVGFFDKWTHNFRL